MTLKRFKDSTESNPLSDTLVKLSGINCANYVVFYADFKCF